MPVQQARPHRRWYHRVPCDPPPEALADRLAEAAVAKHAAARIDSYERLHKSHVDHHHALVRGLLGGVGLALSVGPSVPSLTKTCRDGERGECTLRMVAMAGGALALSVASWSIWDLYRQPDRLSEQVAKLNEELSRLQHRQKGETAVDNLLDVYRHMSGSEKVAFKALLHERAKAPKTAEAAARADEIASGRFRLSDLDSAIEGDGASEV